MKKFNISILILGLALIVSSCKPEVEGELGEPFDKVAGMSGTWEISAFLQKDLNNPIKEERDLSQVYVNGVDQPLRLTFDAATRTYSVDITTGRNFFGTDGTWSFDNDQFPSSLLLDNGVETLEFGLGSVVRPFDNALSIELDKACISSGGDVTETVVYIFNFNRINA
ncbi:MAG: DUF5004 domain-containing protein [Bacteroidota bacterium]